MDSGLQSGPPFRAEHVGSLLRPAVLRNAFRDFNGGRIDADRFREVQDQCIREVVALQEELGFQGVNDGEFRRASYWSHFVEATEGFGVARSRFDFHDDTGQVTHFLSPKVTGKIRRARPISGDEFDFLKSVTTHTPKVTLPSPPTMHFWAKPGSSKAGGYADDEAYLADLTRVFQEEIADLAARGATYLQIDEVPLAMLCDETLRERVRADGDDPDALVGRYVDLINACLAGRPRGMTVGMHLCRGNFKGQWLSEGSYGYVAERIFNDINVDAFFLEYDTPRAGDFTPLQNVPDNKSVVLGLISSKTTALEPVDSLLARIDEASRYLPVERLAISPQCGFASAVSGNPISLEDEKRKLGLVQEVASKVWG